MILFRVAFLCFVGDLYLHSHGHTLAKQVCLIASLSAAAIDKVSFYLIAELFWLVALLVQYVVERSDFLGPKGSKLLADEDKEWVDVDKGPASNKAPDKVLDLLKEARNKLDLNLDAKTNCDGKPWQMVKSQGRIKIFNSEYVGKSIKRWKVEATVYGPLQGVYEQLFDYGKRLGKDGWDTALEKGNEVEEFDDGVALTNYFTAAQGGGAVASRELVDVRLLEFPSTGGFVLANASVDKSFKSVLKNYPKGNGSLTRAFSYPGGGVRLTPITEDGAPLTEEQAADRSKPMLFKYQLVSSLDLKGWIPTSVINSALSTALVESHEAMIAHLEKLYGPTPHAHQS